jgi:integrase
MPLTDKQCQTAKPSDKLRKLSDGQALQLWIFPDGARRWRLDYRYGGKRKTLALGVYPTIGLKDAREAASEARKRLAAGTDPGQQRKLDKVHAAESAAITFAAIAEELIAKKQKEGRAEATVTKSRWIYDMVRPSLGSRPVSEVTSAEILAAIRPIEARGHHETATRTRSKIGEVFRYAIATGRCENDPTSALRGALIRPQVTHRAAIIEPKAFGGLLRAIDGYEGAAETRIALRLLALTFARPGELRHAEWTEFDLEKATWDIPEGRMKMRRPHRMPLAPQAVALLQELKDLTGFGRYLFPSERTVLRPMSENTLNAALRRLGFTGEEMTSHGFRASASSLLYESGRWSSDVIETQLAHARGNEVRRAYDRAAHWPERVRMMCWWADHLEMLRSGGEVIELRRKA